MEIIFYIGVLTGVYLMFENSFNAIFAMKKRYFYSKLNKKLLFNYVKKNFMVVSKDMNEDRVNLKVFKFISADIVIMISMFLVVFIANVRHETLYNTIEYSVMVAFFCTLLPFIFLKFKLRLIQSKGSYEAIIIISEILNQYKIYNHSILESLDHTAKYLPDDLVSKKCMLRLCIRIKHFRSDEELHKILDDFSYSIGTNWSVILSQSLYVAITESFDITSSLEGLLKQVSIVDNNLKYGKKLTNEGFILAKYFAPALYLFMAFIILRMLNINFKLFMFYQFRDEGLKFIIIIIIVFFVCILEEYLYENKKFDF